jgi:hypothetical protein
MIVLTCDANWTGLYTYAGVTTATADYCYYEYYTAQRAKTRQSRLDWLLFTRGRGWTDGSPVQKQVGLAVVHRNRIQPVLRATRRPPRQARWHSLKQLRRLGVL